jgi:hypothetical protein
MTASPSTPMHAYLKRLAERPPVSRECAPLRESACVPTRNLPQALSYAARPSNRLRAGPKSLGDISLPPAADISRPGRHFSVCARSRSGVAVRPGGAERPFGIRPSNPCRQDQVLLRPNSALLALRPKKCGQNQNKSGTAPSTVFTVVSVTRSASVARSPSVSNTAVAVKTFSLLSAPIKPPTEARSNE